jgi:tRNA pseudouridine13 synthase
MVTEPFEPPLQLGSQPGTGGRIGPEAEDFRVDEIPLYPTRGEGQHYFVLLEKRELTTERLVQAVAKASGAKPFEIGSAGMKDKHAVTSQWLSVPATAKAPPLQWQLPEGIRLLEATRHDNKLRTGHLLGNRFRIRLIDLEGTDLLARAHTVRDALLRDGLENYFGAQRFGFGGQNLERALAFARNGCRGRNRFDAKLYPSVLQSEVFNRYLHRRKELGFDRLILGEVVRLNQSGAHFVVEDLDREQPRFAAGDLHLTGPMFGPKCRPASAAGLQLEEQILAELGIDAEMRTSLSRHAPGTRRDLVVRLEALDVVIEAPANAEPEGAEGQRGLVLEFALPAGSYATQLIREFTKKGFLVDPRV